MTIAGQTEVTSPHKDEYKGQTELTPKPGTRFSEGSVHPPGAIAHVTIQKVPSD
jgi:hypothetical protein